MSQQHLNVLKKKKINPANCVLSILVMLYHYYTRLAAYFKIQNVESFGELNCSRKICAKHFKVTSGSTGVPKH